MAYLDGAGFQELEEERENASGLLQKEEEKFGRTQSAIAATCDQLQKSCASYERELRALKARVQQVAPSAGWPKWKKLAPASWLSSLTLLSGLAL